MDDAERAELAAILDGAPELAAIVAVWPKLPAVIQQVLVGIVGDVVRGKA